MERGSEDTTKVDSAGAAVLTETAVDDDDGIIYDGKEIQDPVSLASDSLSWIKEIEIRNSAAAAADPCHSENGTSGYGSIGAGDDPKDSVIALAEKAKLADIYEKKAAIGRQASRRVPGPSLPPSAVGGSGQIQDELAVVESARLADLAGKKKAAPGPLFHPGTMLSRQQRPIFESAGTAPGAEHIGEEVSDVPAPRGNGLTTTRLRGLAKSREHNQNHGTNDAIINPSPGLPTAMSKRAAQYAITGSNSPGEQHSSWQSTNQNSLLSNRAMEYDPPTTMATTNPMSLTDLPDDFMPQTMTTASNRPPPTLRPGAYRESAGSLERNASLHKRVLGREGGAIHEDFCGLEISMGGSTEPTSGLNNVIDNFASSCLSVATPALEEDDPLTLPQAKESKARPHINNQSAKKCRMRILLGILALVVTAVLLGVFAPKSKKEEREKEEKPYTTSTLSPSPAPTPLEDSILSKLPQETVDTILTQPDSPQAKAFEWTLNDVDFDHEHIIQRYTLAVLYYGTNGEEWLANGKWLDHNVSECEWYNKHNFGMKEELLISIPYFLDDFVQPPASERCNEDGLYLHLWLDANGLVGSIPEELYLMNSLKTLGLGFNRIEGTISNRVGTLIDLIGLFIPFAALTGTLPSQLGLLSSLEVANFYVNGLRGQIPDTIWSFPNMTSWGITSSNPQIEPYKLPTEIGLMTNMRWFGAEQSNAYGTIPTEIGLMTDMVGVWFSGVPGSESVYSGTLPSEMGLMTNVLTMEVNFNAFTGTVPTEFGQLEKMNYLNLQNNSLDGTLPKELGFLTNLDNMLIQGNDFTGMIPVALCNMNGSCFAYPSHCAALEQPLQFDCSSEFCGCECSCNKGAI